MKKITLFLMFFLTFSISSEFINPLGFSNSEEEKKQVIDYINKETVKRLADVGITDNLSIKLSKEQELNSFKKLLLVKNKKLLQGVIDQTCKEVGICDYFAIYLIYQQELSASKHNLEW